MAEKLKLSYKLTSVHSGICELKMLATLLIWLSVAVALPKLLDVFLSPDQKNWVDTASVKLWSILDEAKGWSFADWLKQPRATWWLAVSFGLVVCIPVGMYAGDLFEEWGAGKWFEEWGVSHAAAVVSLVCAAFVLWLFADAARDRFKQLVNSKTGEFLVRRHVEIAISSLIVIAASALIMQAVITMINPSWFRTIVILGIKWVRGLFFASLIYVLWLWLARALTGGLGCLNRFSALISGASAGVRLPSGVAAG